MGVVEVAGCRNHPVSRGGVVCQVLNRSNGRSDVFHKDDDFGALIDPITFNEATYCAHSVPKPETGKYHRFSGVRGRETERV